MRSRHRCIYLPVVAGGWLLAVSIAPAATVVTRAIKINDAPISPSSEIEAQPGDRIEAEIYLSGWNSDSPGSALFTYQVTFDGVTLFRGKGSGALLPQGWDAAPLSRCGVGATCSLCSIDDVCLCVTDASCPAEYPICSGICVGPAHDPESAFTVDSTRADFVHFGFGPVSAYRSITHGSNPAIGSTVLMDFGPIDKGQTAYVGTVLLEVSEDACGEFTVEYATLLDEEENSLLLRPSNGAPILEVFPTLVPLRVHVPTKEICEVPLAIVVDSEPSVNTRLSRTRRNTILLTFDRDVTVPGPGELVIHELNDQTCFGPAPGGDLAGFFQITVEADGLGRPRVLRLRDNSVGGILEHGLWYRVTNSGTWGSADPFYLDYRLAVGDANNSGFVSFADLADINMGIPTFHASETNRRDINADGYINFADLAAANLYNPTNPAARPCQK